MTFYKPLIGIDKGLFGDAGPAQRGGGRSGQREIIETEDCFAESARRNMGESAFGAVHHLGYIDVRGGEIRHRAVTGPQAKRAGVAGTLRRHVDLPLQAGDK